MGWVSRIGLLVSCVVVGVIAQGAKGATEPGVATQSDDDVAPERVAKDEATSMDGEGTLAKNSQGTVAQGVADADSEKGSVAQVANMQDGQPSTTLDSQTTIVELLARVTNLTEMVAKLEKDKSDLNASQEKRVADLEASKGRMERDFTKKNGDLIGDKTALTKTNADLTQKNAALTKDKEAADKNIRTQETKIAQLEAAITAEKKKVADLKSEHNKEIDAKGAEMAKLKNQIEQLTKDVESKSVEIESKSVEIESRSSEIDRFKLNLTAAKETIAILNANYSDLAERYADPSVQHFLTRKAIKAYKHPGIEGAANKTYIYVLPSLKAGHLRGSLWLNRTQAEANSHLVRLNAYVSQHVGDRLEPWLPFVTGFLVYGMIGCPLICSAWCLTRIICKLRPCLLFLHLYYALAALCAAVFAGVTGTDPFSAFAAHDASLYLAAQAGFTISLLIYTALLLLACGCSCSGYEWKLRIVQISGAVVVSIPYYELVWTPAMLDQLPKVFDILVDTVGEDSATKLVVVPYGVAACIFAALLSCEQMSLRHQGGQKHVAKTSQGTELTSITIRSDGELRGVEELTSFIGKRGDAQTAKEK